MSGKIVQVKTPNKPIRRHANRISRLIATMGLFISFLPLAWPE